MRERQTLCVESKPVKAELGTVATVLYALAVVDVPGDRVIDAAKVAADLMPTAGPRSSQHQGDACDIGHE